jgi:hypothetical protein
MEMKGKEKKRDMRSKSSSQATRVSPAGGLIEVRKCVARPVVHVYKERKEATTKFHAIICVSFFPLQC